MLNVITEENSKTIKSSFFQKYVRQYLDIEANTNQAIESLGLAFNRDTRIPEKTRQLLEQLKHHGAQFANADKSIFINWRSSACKACQTGVGSITSFISLKCHRDCFFCFNPNQENYDHYCTHQRNAISEFEQLPSKQLSSLTHIALTGGEPLLFKNQTIDFFQKINQKAPQAHTRLYTASEAFSEQTAQRLQTAGLKEIRFSIKTDDTKEQLEKQLRKIKIARQYIPSVMVEMPVIPGTREIMQTLLEQLDHIGIDGINLLEFCFPFRNAHIYQQRGYMLKYPPYDIYYNYWYAGGLAIAESELLCLELLQFAIESHLKIGVHYCSLENKFSGQIYQQNSAYPSHPLYYFSPKDYLLKSAKIFSPDLKSIQKELKNQQIPYEYSPQYQYIQIHPQHIAALNPFDADICLSLNLIEDNDQNEYLIKEVKLYTVNTKQFIFDHI